MSSIRLVTRIAGIALATLVGWVVVLIGYLPALALGRAGRWRAWVAGRWARAMCVLIGMRISVEGPVPRGGFLLVTNHLSYADIPLLSGQTGCLFVSKSEIGDWPLIGYLARLAGTVFVDRERRRDVVRAAAAMREKLAAGHALVLFPEGTSTSGAEVAPFRSSLLEPAAELGVPVYSASIRYSTEEGEVPASHSVAWWGDMTLLPHFANLLRMSRFEARIVFGSEPVRESDRKVLAERLHTAVASRFAPMLREDSEVPERHACHAIPLPSVRS